MFTRFPRGSAEWTLARLKKSVASKPHKKKKKRKVSRVPAAELRDECAVSSDEDFLDFTTHQTQEMYAPRPGSTRDLAYKPHVSETGGGQRKPITPARGQTTGAPSTVLDPTKATQSSETISGSSSQSNFKPGTTLTMKHIEVLTRWRDVYLNAQHLSQRPRNADWTRGVVLGTLLTPVEDKFNPLQEELINCNVTERTKKRWLRAAAKPVDVASSPSPTPSPRGRPRVTELELVATNEFFVNQTYVRSGARNNTRRMHIDCSEMYAIYRAHFPQICRRAKALGEARELPMDTFLETNLVVAERMATAQGWTIHGELLRRTDHFTHQLQEAKLARALAGEMTAHLQHPRTGADPDGISPRCYKTFWDILKRSGTRWLRSEPLYQCPIHEKGPARVRQLAKLQDLLEKAERELERHEADQARAGDDAEGARLRRRVLELREGKHKLAFHVRIFEEHKIHYREARRFVKAVEDGLTENQILIFRDFVNQYNENGN